ncbi:MAG: alpha/beta hydrolase [Sphingomonadaceae bacterium]
MRYLTIMAALGLTSVSASLGAQSKPEKAAEKPNAVHQRVTMKEDGSIDVAPFTMPFSVYASPAAKEDIRWKLDQYDALAPGRTSTDIKVRRGNADKILFTPWLEAQRKAYPGVKMENSKIAGVEVQVFTPADGISEANRNRVLINLHGGAFMIGWGLASQIESIPIAATGKIKVISVNYRMFPEARFPAASEDIERVYRALLETYQPSQIGIYGCSAGGVLTGQASAWFGEKKLPQPAAISIQSGSIAGFAGDSLYTTGRIGGILPPPPPGKDLSAALKVGYFEGAKPDDPLVTPTLSPDLLAKFPPTLFITGTRAADMSGTTASHLALTRAGADSRMYLWDGLDHCFTYNPALPESAEAYAMTIRFFEEIMNGKMGTPRNDD